MRLNFLITQIMLGANGQEKCSKKGLFLAIDGGDSCIRKRVIGKYILLFMLYKIFIELFYHHQF